MAQIRFNSTSKCPEFLTLLLILCDTIRDNPIIKPADGILIYHFWLFITYWNITEHVEICLPAFYGIGTELKHGDYGRVNVGCLEHKRMPPFVTK